MISNYQIQEEIRKRQLRIQEIYDPTSFVVNDEIIKLQKEIYALSQECTHDVLKDNRCIFCGRYFI